MYGKDLILAVRWGVVVGRRGKNHIHYCYSFFFQANKPLSVLYILVVGEIVES